MGIGVIAGFVAGLVAGGVGSRLAMKIVALVAGPDAQGQITENGSTIGVFTAETIFLFFFGAALGIVGDLFYMALRPWLPATGRWRGLACGAALLATGGAMIVEAGNVDFAQFGLPALNVILFAALYLGFGLLVAPLADGLDRRFPALTADQVRQFGTGTLYALVAIGGLPIAFVLLLAVGSANVWILLGGVLLAICGLVALGLYFFKSNVAWRGQRLGTFAFATASGVFGCFMLVIFTLGFIIVSDEGRGETRLAGALVLLVIVTGFGGRDWLARAEQAAGHPRPALILAVPVLLGLSMTIREIGRILFGW